MIGVIAQLGERLNGIQEVGGSIPLNSTILCLFYLFLFLFIIRFLSNNMKKVSFLVLAGALTFILSECGDGGVAHSLKEVYDNPNTKYDKLEADIIYEMIEIDLTGGKDPIIRKDIRIYDANGYI